MNQLFYSGQWATLSAHKKPSSKFSNLSANITSVLMALIDLDPQSFNRRSKSLAFLEGSKYTVWTLEN